MNSVPSIFSICLALSFLPLQQQAFMAESKNRMGTDIIQLDGQWRSPLCVDKSAWTFSQSVINCTCLCGYFYHMISSSHMLALLKFDFSCDLSWGYPYCHQHFTSTLISVQPGNDLVAHEHQLIFNLIGHFSHWEIHILSCDTENTAPAAHSKSCMISEPPFGLQNREVTKSYLKVNKNKEFSID